MKEDVKNDAERKTAQDAVRHPVSEEGVPVRNITFGDFLMEDAESLIQHLLSEGGATIHPISMEIQQRSQGYAVALNTGHGEYPFNGASSLREVLQLKLDSVRTEAAENNRYIGCWIEVDAKNKTSFCFETSVIIDDLNEAMSLGYTESQKAIWDFKNQTEIYLISFGDFLKDEAFRFKEKLIRSISYPHPIPSTLVDELVYLRWRYFISDEDFISDYQIWYSMFESGAFSALIEDWEEEEYSIDAYNYILTSFGSQRGVRKAMEHYDFWSVDDFWEQNVPLGTWLHKMWLANK